MNIITILIGVAAMCFGIYTAWARIKKPEQLKKLEPMKSFWGERVGSAIHFVGYILIPVFFGIVVTYKGILGGSIY